MTRLEWDQMDERLFDSGVDHAALYLDDGLVVPWNGVTSIKESFTAETSQPYYMDGIKHEDLPQIGSYAATLSAFTYPLEFMPYEGWSEPDPGIAVYGDTPRPFNLIYRELIGTAVDGFDFSYKLHILYNLLAVPSDVSRDTRTNDPAAVEFSWDISSIPVNFPGHRPTAHYILNAMSLGQSKMRQIEAVLFGDETTEPYLPPPETILSNLSGWSVVDNGDGTWTASSTDPNAIIMTSSTQFQINHPLAVYVDEDTYTLNS